MRFISTEYSHNVMPMTKKKRFVEASPSVDRRPFYIKPH